MARAELFFLNLIVPVLLVGLAIFVLRTRRVRGEVARPWALAVALAALWSTHLASYYLADMVGEATRAVALVAVGWRAAAVYLLSAFALAVLWTTMRYMRIVPPLGRMTLVAGLVLMGVALLLDPDWRLLAPSAATPVLEVSGQTLRYFDFWAAVWGGSYLLPLLMGWILTQQTFRRLPSSLYRNQVAYWSLALLLLLVAGPLALLRDPSRSLWQFLAALLIGGTAATATLSMVQRRLPNLQVTFRQGVRAIIVGTAFFGLAWFGLWFATTTSSGRLLLGRSGGLLVAALIATVVFLLARQLLGRLTRLLLLRLPALPEMPLQGVRWGEVLLDPQALGRLILADVQRHLGVDDAWLMLVGEGPAGQRLLRPLLALNGAPLPDPGVLEDGSPFLRFLTHGQTIARTDLTALPEYDALSPRAREQLIGWARDLYVPFTVDESLSAVLGLGRRTSGEVYDDRDRFWLRALSIRAAPLLWQAQNAERLHTLSLHAFDRSAELARERHQQEALLDLYRNGLALLTPDLHRRLDELDDRWQALYPVIPDEAEIDEDAFNAPLAALKDEVNTLLVAYGRLAKFELFVTNSVQLDEIVRDVVGDLATMARARRVEVRLSISPELPAVCGDPDRLREAVQQLLHNAIKFNKIGGSVTLTCAVQGDDVALSLVDTGVGIPPERLSGLWHTADGGRLGLTLTRAIVEAHGGQVEAASHYGAGSTFTLRLPVAEV